MISRRDLLTRAAAGVMAGTGGTPPPPLNAPAAAAGAATGGIQPGQSSAIVTANKVIVFGPGDGVFVYAGIPALGNPPIAWMAAGLTDPYGNTLPSTTGVAGTGTFEAGDMIITSSGLFIYSATPAAGNLIMSFAPVGGTDMFGNAYTPGLIVYNSAATLGVMNAGDYLPGGLTGGGGAMLLASGALSDTDGESGLTVYSTLAAGNGQPLAQLDVGSGTWAILPAAVTPPVPPLGAGQYSTVNDTPAFIKPGGALGMVPLTQADTTAYTITAAGSNQASRSWEVFGGDAVAGTAYRLTVWGTGTEGTTADTLDFNMSGLWAAATWLSNNMSGAPVGVSGAFHWRLTCDIAWVSATSFVAGSLFTWSESVTGTASNAATSAAAGTVSGLTISGNSNLTLQMGWNAVTGAPTITSLGSVFERLGA